jgi:uncharacterized protein
VTTLRSKQSGLAVTWRRSLIILVMLLSVSAGSGADLDELEAAFLDGRYEGLAQALEPFAAVGVARAQWILGHLYADGLGVHEDRDRAISLLRRASGSELPEAPVLLGKLLWQSPPRITLPNSAHLSEDEIMDQANAIRASEKIEAIRWFRLAAEQGDVAGQFWLGLSALEFPDAGVDADEALQWIRRAAESHYPPAETALGALSWDEGNFSEAQKWFERAAKQGLSEAQYCLGLMLSEGDGVPQDLEEARRWFNLAANQGHLEAKQALTRLNRFTPLTQSQIRALSLLVP